MASSPDAIEWQETEAQVQLGKRAMISGRGGAFVLGIAALATVPAVMYYRENPLLFGLPAIFVFTLVSAHLRSKRAREILHADLLRARKERRVGFRVAATSRDVTTTRLCIDEDGVERSRGSAFTRLRWPAVAAIVALPDGHVRFIAYGGEVFFVPAWAFDDEEGAARLVDRGRALEQAKIGPAPPNEAPPIAGGSSRTVSVTVPATFEVLLESLPSRARLAFRVIAAFVVGLLSWVVVAISPELAKDPSFMPLTMLAVIAAAALPSHRLLVRPFFGQFRRHELFRVSFSEDGFAWASSLGSGSTPWSETTIQRTQNALNVNRVVVPRRLVSPDDYKALVIWRARAGAGDEG